MEKVNGKSTNTILKLKVYDPNYPMDGSRFIYLNGNGTNFTSWSYDTGADLWGTVGGSIGQSTSGVHYDIHLKPLSGNSYLDSRTDWSEDLFLLILEGMDPGLFGPTDLYDVMDFMTNTSSGSSETSGCYWLAKAGSYVLENVPAGACFTIAGESHAATVEVEKNCDITVAVTDSGENRVQVTSGEASQVKVTFKSYEGNTATLMTAVTTADAGVSALITQSTDDGTVTLGGLSNVEVNETVKKINESGSETVLSSTDISAEELDVTKQYQITETEEDGSEANTLVQDEDGDGVFETVLQAVKKEKTDISSYTVTLPETSYLYTGAAITPEVTVSNGTDTLTKDKDYTVTYDNNTTVGTATVQVTGRGYYKGTIRVSFEIYSNEHVWGDWTPPKNYRLCIMSCWWGRQCSRCGAVDAKFVDAAGHRYGDWVVTKEATAVQQGEKQKTCSVCGDIMTTTSPRLTPSITLPADTIRLQVKQSTSAFKVSGMAKGDYLKSVVSGNTSIVKVSKVKKTGSFKLTAQKKVGKAMITITLASGLERTISVNVQKGIVRTIWIGVEDKTLTIQKGKKVTLKPKVNPITSQQKVTYTSSNRKVATVTSKGVITAKKAGTAKITVKSGNRKVVVKVTVPKTKTTKITGVKEAINLKKGKTYTLKAKVYPGSSEEKITYKSSNKKVASVTGKGRIKGIKKGKATITVKSGSVVVKCKVTVK